MSLSHNPIFVLVIVNSWASFSQKQQLIALLVGKINTQNTKLLIEESQLFSVGEGSTRIYEQLTIFDWAVILSPPLFDAPIISSRINEILFFVKALNFAFMSFDRCWTCVSAPAINIALSSSTQINWIWRTEAANLTFALVAWKRSHLAFTLNP